MLLHIAQQAATREDILEFGHARIERAYAKVAAVIAVIIQALYDLLLPLAFIGPLNEPVWISESAQVVQGHQYTTIVVREGVRQRGSGAGRRGASVGRRTSE